MTSLPVSARAVPARPPARDVGTGNTRPGTRRTRTALGAGRPNASHPPAGGPRFRAAGSCKCPPLHLRVVPGNLAAKLDCRSKPPIPPSPVKVLILLRTEFSFSSLMNRPALFPRPPSVRSVLTDRRLGEETACAEEWRGGGGWNDCRAPRARGKIVDFFL